MPHDVFISHSSKDKPLADAVCAMLEQAEIRCWIAPRDIAPGSDWGEAIVDGLSRSKVLVLLFSQHSNESLQVRREVQRAFEMGLPVVPFRLEAVVPHKSLTYYIGPLQWLDAANGAVDQQLPRLRDAVVHALHDEKPTDDTGIVVDPSAAQLAARGPMKGTSKTVPERTLALARAGGAVLALTLLLRALACLFVLLGDYQVNGLETGETSTAAFKHLSDGGPALWQVASFWMPYTAIAIWLAWMFWADMLGRYVRAIRDRPIRGTSTQAVLLAGLVPGYNFVGPPIVMAALFIGLDWPGIVAVLVSVGWWALFMGSLLSGSFSHVYPLTAAGIPPVSADWKLKTAEFIRADYRDLAAAALGACLFWFTRPRG
jgi:hypothetical protein